MYDDNTGNPETSNNIEILIEAQERDENLVQVAQAHFTQAIESGDGNRVSEVQAHLRRFQRVLLNIAADQAAGNSVSLGGRARKGAAAKFLVKRGIEILLRRGLWIVVADLHDSGRLYALIPRGKVPARNDTLLLPQAGARALSPTGSMPSASSMSTRRMSGSPIRVLGSSPSSLLSRAMPSDSDLRLPAQL